MAEEKRKLSRGDQATIIRNDTGEPTLLKIVGQPNYEPSPGRYGGQGMLADWQDNLNRQMAEESAARQSLLGFQGAQTEKIKQETEMGRGKITPALQMQERNKILGELFKNDTSLIGLEGEKRAERINAHKDLADQLTGMGKYAVVPPPQPNPGVSANPGDIVASQPQPTLVGALAQGARLLPQTIGKEAILNPKDGSQNDQPISTNSVVNDILQEQKVVALKKRAADLKQEPNPNDPMATVDAEILAREAQKQLIAQQTTNKLKRAQQLLFFGGQYPLALPPNAVYPQPPIKYTNIGGRGIIP